MSDSFIQIPTKLPERLHKKVVNIMRDSIDKYPTTKQILDKGLNYLKKQEWYQNLNQQEKNYLEFNLIKHLKQGYEPIPKQKTRTEIKAEVFHELAKGKSDEVIISKYKNRRDQSIAKKILNPRHSENKILERLKNKIMKNKQIINSVTAIIIAFMFCLTYYFVNSNNNRYQFYEKDLFILDKKTGDVFFINYHGKIEKKQKEEKKNKKK